MPSQFTAGVDLGATNVRVVIANEDGEIEARRAGPLPPGSPEDVLERPQHERTRRFLSVIEGQAAAEAA